MREINLTEEQLIIVENILRNYLPPESKVWLFGSRATGKSKPYSDIDLAIDNGQSLSLEVLSRLAAAFEESLLPYKVDIVDWQACDTTFQEIILRDGKRVL